MPSYGGVFVDTLGLIPRVRVTPVSVGRRLFRQVQSRLTRVELAGDDIGADITVSFWDTLGTLRPDSRRPLVTFVGAEVAGIGGDCARSFWRSIPPTQK